MKTRIYFLPNSDQHIILMQSALDMLSAHRQTGEEAEVGGLLFAEFDFPVIRIVEASPPHTKDKRWKTLFIPSRRLQRRLIKRKFKKGLHFIGEWHTHPTKTPVPSSLDLKSMADSFDKSHHELNYFIMIIVGNSPKSLSLWVSAHDAQVSYHLK